METIACTLSQSDRDSRGARWHALAAAHLAGIDETATGLRLRFTGGSGELAQLVDLERACCAFARWTLSGTTLLVDAETPEAVAAVHGLFLALR